MWRKISLAMMMHKDLEVMMRSIDMRTLGASAAKYTVIHRPRNPKELRESQESLVYTYIRK